MNLLGPGWAEWSRWGIRVDQVARCYFGARFCSELHFSLSLLWTHLFLKHGCQLHKKKKEVSQEKRPLSLKSNSLSSSLKKDHRHITYLRWNPNPLFQLVLSTINTSQEVHRKNVHNIHMETLMVLHCGFITADHQLLLPFRIKTGADVREPWKKFSLGGVRQEVVAKNDIFTLTQLMSTAVSITLPSLSWRLSCVVINFPGQFMPNIRGREQCELIAFLTIHFSPWNVISPPQLMSLFRAGNGETRPQSQNSVWGTYF